MKRAGRKGSFMGSGSLGTPGARVRRLPELPGSAVRMPSAFVGVALVLVPVFSSCSRPVTPTRPNNQAGARTPGDLEQKPYYALATPRDVVEDSLPDDLAHFYTHHEGVGLESSPERLVRLCTLAEVERVGWSDLHVIGSEPLEGWEDFSAYRIGVSAFFDEIVYVVDAPSCKRGAIFATGPDIMGPGGEGPLAYDGSMVLAPSLKEWLKRLERFGWMDFGLCPGEIDELPEEEQDEVRRYYQALNPKMDRSSE